MPRTATRSVPAWEDQFLVPRASDLLGGLSRPFAALAETIRTRCLSGEDVTEHVGWHGVAWRWTLEYRTDPDRRSAWVYLIPRPAKPLICVPFPADLLEVALAARISRAVREGLVSAPRVGNTFWPQWELVSRSALDEVLMVAQHALAAMRQPA
jgi:hypothetical protein